ncbi:sensor histidine kinase [Propionivibrio dicarboxylicus]|uniref:histidine kinase n=1 Tax=Propionivibrio dicarboxylicus TaxID=83767 RepID=A0A1G8I1I1_9RHOO|nr:HAMP domain-containing sensor histidine kinase [Propionivibrio dicarboxylicus]SDI12845.1 two-component system, CAI-1 autoinducer sensor kinase/phosphatase CqsS [Propionivibrio dicarboxylicus]
MNTPYQGIKDHLSNAMTQANRNVEYFDRRRVALGSIGFVAFPLYYWIWSYLFPQPYENLWLRLIGSLLFLPLVFSKHWPSAWRRHLPALWYFTLLYCLPFFFTFMLLKNDSSEVWIASVLVALFAMALLLDWLSLIVHFVLGTLLAWMLYAATTEAARISLVSIIYLPIFAFAIALGAAANYASLMVRVEQERAMIATASSIAHELRTPLLNIATTATGLGEYLPDLLKAYELAKSAHLEVPPIRSIHIESMKNALKRVEVEAMHSNTIIDMLLMSARQTQRNGIVLAECSIRCSVETALERYPLSPAERALITIDPRHDFQFTGNKLLMVHVIFNLVKNALRHIAKAGKGDIRISFRAGDSGNALLFRDTGLGIRPEHVSHIFSRFYTSTEDNDNILGAGIGLAFCHDVMTLFGGSITCRSVFSEFTEFELNFPAI